MRTRFKAAIAALALAGAVATPASAQEFGLGIGPNGGISFSYDSGGYCDQWGCPDDFWDMPVYYGSVFFAGQWYDGPVYYRDWYGAREYWIHGQWHRDEWRGPRPGWYRPGRYGPALGMDYYRSHNFHGRWDQDRGRNFGPGDNRGRDFAPRGDDRRNGPQNNQQNQRNFGNGRPQQNAAPNPAPGAFDPRGRGQRTNHPQAAPAPAPAAAPPPDNHGRRGRRDDHNDH